MSRILTASAVLALLAGCERPARPPGDVLVVTLDTVRADHLSYTGAAPVVTPQIDALAGRGTAFLQAIAPAPITLVSHTTLFTGLLPPAHGVRNNSTYRLSDEVPTLAATLAAHGWATAAFVGASVLDARYGLDRGFDTYDDQVEEGEVVAADHLFGYDRRPADSVVSSALDWLTSQRDPSIHTLVWVHLFDAHSPYFAPEPEASLYPDQPYRAAVAWLDRAVGTLLDGYAAQGCLDRTLVVLAADHGESLGEHGETTHGVLVYDATVRVPLVLSGPGVPAGGRIPDQVGLHDVAPTILDLVGLASPPGVQGRNLGPLLRGEGQPDRVVDVESLLPTLDDGWASLRGLRTPAGSTSRGRPWSCTT